MSHPDKAQKRKSRVEHLIISREYEGQRIDNFLVTRLKGMPKSHIYRILYEDEILLILNKPSGMSVHAGSTVRVGVVEALRHMYPKLLHLELAHRLDSETSGCLVLC